MGKLGDVRMRSRSLAQLFCGHYNCWSAWSSLPWDEHSKATWLRLRLWVLGRFCGFCGYCYSEECLQRLVVSVRAALPPNLQQDSIAVPSPAVQKPKFSDGQPAPSSGSFPVKFESFAKLFFLFLFIYFYFFYT